MTWTEGINKRLGVKALEKDWGNDRRREGTVQRWLSACRPLIEKVYVHVSHGCTIQAAVKLCPREKNDEVIVPRRGRKAAI